MNSLSSALMSLASEPRSETSSDRLMRSLAHLVPDLVHAVDYASVTVDRGGRSVTLASTSELVVVAASRSWCGPVIGPHVPTQTGDAPTVATPWAQFREQARVLGFGGPVSIPLFAVPSVLASLDLWALEPAPLSGLAARVATLYADIDAIGDGARLDEGSENLLAALGAALVTHGNLHRAIGTIMSGKAVPSAEAYRQLCADAERRGKPLATVVNEVLALCAARVQPTSRI